MQPAIEHIAQRLSLQGLRYALVLAMIQLVSAPARAAEPVLDLSKGSYNGRLATAPVGPSPLAGTSSPNAKAPKKPPLPLEVTIQSISPSIASSGDKVTIVILIRNIGKGPVMIPASMNDLEVLRDGNQDKREIVVGLRLIRKDGTKTMDCMFGSAVGTASMPDSAVTLLPQESLLVRAAEFMFGTWAWHEAGLPADQVTVRAYVEQWFFEDDQYRIKNSSDRLLSKNAFEITWKPEL